MKAKGSWFGALSRLSLFGLLSATILTTGLPAQIGTQGTFVGTLKDTSGAVVVGATVTATNNATGESQSVSTNQDGLYRISQLPPGHYRLQTTQTGFRAEIHNDIELTVSQTQEVDFTLQVGANTETVTVTGEAPLVDTSTSTVSSLVSQEQVQDLPLNGRDYSQLLYLSPGVSNGWGAVNQARGNPQFEIAGARSTSTRYMMDGNELSGAGITSNTLPNTASSKLLGVESIAEFSVISNDGDASLGKEQGGEINMVTRSGTNDLHGSAYEFFRSKAFDAANYFVPDILPLTRNNYGGSVGGPIRKNKTFFFVNFEQYKDRENFADASEDPTPAARGLGTGVEQIPTGTVVGGVCQIASINLTTGVQTVNVGGTAPSTPRSLAAVQASNSILNFYPAGLTAAEYANGVPQTQNISGTVCPTGIEAVSVSAPQRISDTFIMGRVDHQISEKQSLFGRYLIQTGTRYENVNDLPLNEFLQNNPLSAQIFTVGHRYAFSSGLLNQFTVSWNRGFYNILPQAQVGISQSEIPAALTLIPAGTPPCGAVNDNCYPLSQLGTLAVGGLPSMNSSTILHEIGRNVYEADEQLSKNVGKHFLQGGVQFQRFFIGEHGGSNPGGSVSFGNLLAIADGIPTSFTGGLPCCSNPFVAARQFYVGTYLQDSYKIKQNLTLNYGIRWEFMSEEVERFNRFLNWYPVLGGDGACAATISCFPAFPAFANGGFPASFSEPGLVYPATNISPINHSGNWAPRLGFAWNVFGSGKTSVRGGFGLFYNQIQVNPSAFAPFYASVTVTGTTAAPVPWPTPGTVLGTAVGSSPTLAGTVPNPEIPAMQQYNLTIQQEVAPQTTLSVAYVGNEGYHNARTGDADLPAPVPNAAGQLVFPSMTTLTKNANGALSTNPGALTIYDANSNYNSLQATLEKRLSRGLQLKAVFAWSKGVDEAPDPSAGSPVGIGASSILQYPRYDKGLEPFDVGKAFTFNWIYDLPTGKHDGVTGLALNNWEFDGIYHQQSGLPFSMLDGVSEAFSTGNAQGSTRPDYNPAFTGSIINSGSAERFGPQQVRYYNPNAFVPAPYGVLGSLGITPLTGPGLANVDISLAKHINLTERYKLQFRVDAFNVLNHPNFSQPTATNATEPLYTAIANSSATTAAGATSGNSCYIGAAVGAATTACSQALYALGEINPVTVQPAANAGLITQTATDNRELQFSLKLVF